MLPRISDSNYVPLSATQAPVTGLTDILTPVNLLPNSDFSRSGGYDTAQTWETLNGGTNYFSYNWYVAPNLSTFNNVSLTINNDKSVTITGTAISTTRSDGNFALILHSIFSNHYDFFTLACDKSNVSNCDVFPQTNGTFEEVYSNQENSRSVMILKDTSTNTNMHAVFSILVPGDKINQQFSITLKNLVAYEGEFKNPPVTTSLDVKPGNQFLRNDTYNLMHSALINYYDSYSFNQTTAQVPAVPAFQNILGPANTTTATKIYLGRITPNHANSIAYASKFKAIGTLYLLYSHGLGKPATPTKYTIDIGIVQGSTPTVDVTATKISGNNITVTIGYDTENNSYGKIIKPYITITNSDTTFITMGYILYECMLAGYGILCRFPVYVNKDTAV